MGIDAHQWREAGLPSELWLCYMQANNDVREAVEEAFYIKYPHARYEPCCKCAGKRGGVPGNETTVKGLIVCYYCGADMIGAT